MAENIHVIYADFGFEIVNFCVHVAPLRNKNMAPLAGQDKLMLTLTCHLMILLRPIAFYAAVVFCFFLNPTSLFMGLSYFDRRMHSFCCRHHPSDGARNDG